MAAANAQYLALQAENQVLAAKHAAAVAAVEEDREERKEVVAGVARSRALPRIAPPPTFSGDADRLESWKLAMLQQLSYYRSGGQLVEQAQEIQFLLSALGGPALQYMLPVWPTAKSGSEFIQLLTDRFMPVLPAVTARQQITTIKQYGKQSVNEFSSQFLSICMHLPKMDEEDKVHHFVRALLPSLREKLYDKESKTLRDAMEHAGRAEAWLNQGKAFGSHSAPMDLSNMEEQERPTAAAAAATSSSSSAGKELVEVVNALRAEVKSMSKRKNNKPAVEQLGLPADVKLRRQQNRLCFKCGGANHSMYSCTNPLNKQLN